MENNKSLKSRIKSKAPKWIKQTYRYIKANTIKEKKLDFKAKKCLRELSMKEKTHKFIKVGFLVQMAEVWDKQEQLYDALKNNENFETYMIVVPSYDFAKRELKYEYDDSFFFNNYSEAIKALNDDGEWLELQELDLDYLFYQRPYNEYLPECYKSYNVGKYIKCMYIPYAFWPLQEMLCGYSKEFFRYMYISFMESEEHAKALRKMHSEPARIVFCGYPQLSDVRVKNEYDINKILWTPRWSYAPKIGGSHFLEYKDEIVELAANSDDIEVVLRPHPLSFENYIRMGLMTVAEVNDYKQKVENTSRVSFDTNKNIEDTFEETGILITDVSSIVFPYFLTGKPIIFCNTEIPLSPAFKTLLEGIYVTENWEEICDAYKQIASGNDYLKEKRLKIAESIRNMHKDSVNKIINLIEKDYYK